ncbi:MAG: hypothetical protein GY798_34625 [Hyphomicrobiales bacterium]|nr:hypothetical protein [Hyphomicrobiales bacterium]
MDRPYRIRGCLAGATTGLAFLAAALLAPSPSLAQASQAAYDFSRRLGTAMEKCWFGANAGDFAKYVYSPEPNATGGPRILIVPRGSPHELPVLVIEIHMQGNTPRLNVYGPLAATNLQSRIAADLRRWMDGGNGCG